MITDSMVSFFTPSLNGTGIVLYISPNNYDLSGAISFQI